MGETVWMQQSAGGQKFEIVPGTGQHKQMLKDGWQVVEPETEEPAQPIDLMGLGFQQLKEMAASLGVPDIGSLKSKAALVEAIQATQSQNANGEQEPEQE